MSLRFEFGASTGLGQLAMADAFDGQLPPGSSKDPSAANTSAICRLVYHNANQVVRNPLPKNEPATAPP